MNALRPELTDRVLSAVDDGRPDLIEAISNAVRIPSVNPRDPGRVYDEVVGIRGAGGGRSLVWDYNKD